MYELLAVYEFLAQYNYAKPVMNKYGYIYSYSSFTVATSYIATYTYMAYN